MLAALLCSKSAFKIIRSEQMKRSVTENEHFDPTHQSNRNHQALIKGRKATFKKSETDKIKQIFKEKSLPNIACHAKKLPKQKFCKFYLDWYFSKIGFLWGQPHSLKGCHPRGHALQKLQPAS